MLITVFILALIAFSGMALTYLIADDEPFMWRLMAGSIASSSFFAVIVFVAASMFGFSSGTIIVSIGITLLPLLLLRRPDIHKRFFHDWAKAKGTLTGGSLKKSRRFIYYGFFFIVFWYFFAQAVYALPEGLHTGASQNLGDLSFHLGAIFGFSEGITFPPQNPSWAGAKFSYPFVADLLAACFVKLGIDFKDVIFVQNVSWAFALLVILERFAVKLTNSKLAGRIAPAILFFTGGLGFIWFFKDFGESGKAFFDFLAKLPTDYTIGDSFRWGNSMIVLFITQRGILFGMPLAILVLSYFWNIFSDDKAVEIEGKKAGEGKLDLKQLASDPYTVKAFLVGLLAGTLPLVHLHSLAMLFIVTVFLFAMRPDRWRQWIAFGIGVVIIAIPELVWSITGSATETTKFFGWHFGWDKRENGFLWFWFKNTGIMIPAIFAGLYLFWSRLKSSEPAESAETSPPPKKTKKHKAEVRPEESPIDAKTLLLFYIPFAFLFLLSNVVKLAPWEWDNIKILIYWFVGSIPFIAYALAWAWERNRAWKTAAGICFVVLTLSGALDVWRVASSQMKNGVFNADSMKLAEQIKQKTAPGAMFLNAPTFNSTVVLSGRQSLMRYPGHLGSYGIDYGPREADVKQIYQGGPNADALLKKYDIEYVVMSPEERYVLKPNEEFFKKFPIIAESGQYKVYKVKN